MKIRVLIMLTCLVMLVSCGGQNATPYDPTVPTQTDPYINRINPTTATAGDTVTIFGRGFSSVPEFNVVIIDSVEALAATYTLLAAPTSDEIESLTFVVPAGISVGNHFIFVYVVDNPSNTDVTITIN